jgi:flavodoxin
MFEVVYFSLGGNTRKVAEAIAGELGVTAKNIKSVGTLPEDSFIFLGSGCYGSLLPGEVAEFISRNHLNQRKIVLFTTSAFGWGKEMAMMQKQIQDKGVIITGSFNCYGQFVAIKRGHPDHDDLDKARAFARLMVVQQYPQMTEVENLTSAALVGGKVSG